MRSSAVLVHIPEAEPVAGLPLHARVSEAQLYAEDPAGRWHQLCSLPLAG